MSTGEAGKKDEGKLTQNLPSFVFYDREALVLFSSASIA